MASSPTARARVTTMCSRWARAASSSPAAAATAAAAAGAGAAPAARHAGILAAEFYVPGRFVSQTKLEAFDKVSAGKYTVGLGQAQMAFVDDREDVNSIALTAVARLLERYKIDPRAVGRLEVGTESLVDKSKSTKTTLMRLFAESGNRDIEGATVMNACYGGTAALLNSAAWAESSEAGGRFAVYVACDVAVYEAGPARPTGGVGAVACLVGLDAPLALVPRSRSSHSVDVYDFYKPNMSSEYPAVDGKLSQGCYLQAVDDCYQGTLARLEALRGGAPLAGVEAAFDHVAFHSPYNKLVQQSFRRMLFNDARRAAARGEALPAHLAALAPFVALPAAQTLANKELDKALAPLGAEAYARMVGPSEALSKAVGNTYTGALHLNLLSLVGSAAAGGAKLEGKSVGAFSYGSGAIATMFALRGRAPAAAGAPFSLARMSATLDTAGRLAARTEASPEEFTAALLAREKFYGRTGCSPAGALEHVPAGAFFLEGVGADGARKYGRKA
jgi:hydroxymethylglutaryl-CoA synthase